MEDNIINTSTNPGAVTDAGSEPKQPKVSGGRGNITQLGKTVY